MGERIFLGKVDNDYFIGKCDGGTSGYLRNCLVFVFNAMPLQDGETEPQVMTNLTNPIPFSFIKKEGLLLKGSLKTPRIS